MFAGFPHSEWTAVGGALQGLPRKVVQQVLLTLPSLHLQAVKHKDHFAPLIFKKGAPMVGILPVSGNGTRIVAETVPDPQSLLR